MLPHTVKAEVKDLLLVTKTQNTAAINAENDGVGIYKKTQKNGYLSCLAPKRRKLSRRPVNWSSPENHLP